MHVMSAWTILMDSERDVPVTYKFFEGNCSSEHAHTVIQ